jgi:hypothetical protein
MYQQQQMHQTQYHHHQQLYGYQVFKRRSKQNVESVDALPMMPRKASSSISPHVSLPAVCSSARAFSQLFPVAR